MRILIRLFALVAAISVSFSTNAFAQPPVPDASTTPAQSYLIPEAPSLDVKAYVLMDAKTGHIIASKNADDQLEPASLTKLMSLYLVFSSLQQGTIHLDDKVHISEQAWHTGGSRMFIKAGNDIAVEELIQGVVVDSGNDATVALAEHVAGSESSFVDMMNIAAKRLGMKNSHFEDATGLPDDNHYASAMDLALLAEAIVQEFPEYYHYFSEKWFTFNDIKQPNRNRLLWRYDGADGFKTGHTDKAGYCLVSSALKNDMRLITVVMGAPSDEARSSDSIRLLTYGFRFYKTIKVFDTNLPVTTAKVWKAKQDSVDLGLQKPLFVTIPSGAGKFIKTNTKVNPKLSAPIVKGKAYGRVDVTLHGKVIASKPLIALSHDAAGGWWTNMSDSVKMTVNSWFNKDDAAED